MIDRCSGCEVEVGYTNHIWRRSRLHEEKIERRTHSVVMNEHEILE